MKTVTSVILTLILTIGLFYIADSVYAEPKTQQTAEQLCANPPANRPNVIVSCEIWRNGIGLFSVGTEYTSIHTNEEFNSAKVEEIRPDGWIRVAQGPTGQRKNTWLKVENITAVIR